jgi:hypothetical protein
MTFNGTCFQTSPFSYTLGQLKESMANGEAVVAAALWEEMKVMLLSD